jgi:hypothetical protein
MQNIIGATSVCCKRLVVWFEATRNMLYVDPERHFIRSIVLLRNSKEFPKNVKGLCNRNSCSSAHSATYHSMFYVELLPYGTLVLLTLYSWESNVSVTLFASCYAYVHDERCVRAELCVSQNYASVDSTHDHAI